MLDALAEGVIIMDTNQQIVMANDAFCRIAGEGLSKIQGRKVSQIPALVERASEDQTNSLLQALAATKPIHRMTVRLTSPEGKDRSLVLNIVPVLGNDGSRRGVLATFDDVTTIEATNTQLRGTLHELAESRDEIARQNKELEALASRDPLTGCFNRRAFMRTFEEMWNRAAADRSPLACIMLDIDEFKSINDRYGHGVGDQVLKQMGKVLEASCRAEDIICRYGGEEFCILLPGATFDTGHQTAERIRQAILAHTWPITTVTSSLGVTGIEAGAPDSRQLLEQADKALYAAKRTGRNRVIPWGDPAIEATASQKPDDRRNGGGIASLKQVANALLHALAQRDQATADHSKRVAELTSLMVPSDHEQAELVRLGALLHDVGKMAVPDAILHKPGPLTPEEWAFMRKHEHAGADLIQEAAGDSQLKDIIRTHHAWYGGTPDAPELPVGNQIPFASRCIAIADAYDAMTSDRPYRKAMPHEDACEELIRCSGTQFDPLLVTTFIERITDRRGPIAETSAASHTTAITAMIAEVAELATLVTAAAPTPAQLPMAAFASRRPAKPIRISPKKRR